MKTLAEVEPRTNLQATPLPAGVTTDADRHFIINQPGSYYLSANLGVTKTDGIQINAEGVTLDLNGFQISRTSGTGGNGIFIFGNRASVRNGSIKGFSYGISTISFGGSARGSGFRDLAVSGCSVLGISAGEGAVLESCRAHDNSGTGILAGSGSSFTNCTASNNLGTFTHGIFADSGSSLTNCSAFDNTGSFGISAGSGSSLTNCSAFSNNSANPYPPGSPPVLVARSLIAPPPQILSTAPSSPTTGMGFRVGANSTIKGATANLNKGDGIQAGVASTVSGCTANENGSGTIGLGISAGHRASITGSTTNSNKADGIRILDGGTVSGCTANDNGGKGISAGSGCAITRNLTRTNVADGIYAVYSSQIEGNNCNGDGTGDGPWGGIRVGWHANRVEGNNVTYPSKAGILIEQGGNVIVRNTVKGQCCAFPHFSIAANNVYGPIVDRTNPASAAVSGTSAPSSTGTTDPLANIAFTKKRKSETLRLPNAMNSPLTTVLFLFQLSVFSLSVFASGLAHAVPARPRRR